MARRGHLKAIRKKKAKPSRGSEQQLIVLDQLKELATKTGIEVREERLHREIGYTVRGGRCVLDGHEVLMLDRASSASDCIEVLLDFLSECDLDEMYVEPQLRQLIGGRAAAVLAEADPAATSTDGNAADIASVAPTA